MDFFSSNLSRSFSLSLCSEHSLTPISSPPTGRATIPSPPTSRTIISSPHADGLIDVSRCPRRSFVLVIPSRRRCPLSVAAVAVVVVTAAHHCSPVSEAAMPFCWPRCYALPSSSPYRSPPHFRPPTNAANSSLADSNLGRLLL